MSIYRQVVDGAVQVPMPDEPVARAKAFAEVAMAWSTMLSSIEHLLPPNGKAATLTGGSERMPDPLYRVTLPRQVASPPPPVAEPAKSSSKSTGRPLGSKDKKRRKSRR